MENRALLFTGQGYQYAGMVRELMCSEHYDEVKKVASEVLGVNIEELDSSEALKNNQNVQLAIYLSEIIYLKEIENKVNYKFVAGHSVGTYAAAVASGAITFVDGLKLVNLRGKLMQTLHSKKYKMIAVNGLNLSVLERFIAKFDNIYIANINSDTQNTVTGDKYQLSALHDNIKKNYPIKISTLNVSVPSHCILMSPIIDEVQLFIERINFNTPRCRYLMNSTGRATLNKELIKKDLIDNIVKPVQWRDIQRLMVEHGVDEFIELSQASTLVNIGQKSFPCRKWYSHTL